MRYIFNAFIALTVHIHISLGDSSKEIRNQRKLYASDSGQNRMIQNLWDNSTILTTKDFDKSSTDDAGLGDYYYDIYDIE